MIDFQSTHLPFGYRDLILTKASAPSYKRIYSDFTAQRQTLKEVENSHKNRKRKSKSLKYSKFSVGHPHKNFHCHKSFFHFPVH